MSQVRQLGACFSPAAREHVEARLGAIKGYEPTLGLLYGVDPERSDGAGSWSTVALADETIADLVATYARFGADVRFELDGLTVVVAQIGHLKQLDSGVLELRGNRLWPEQHLA